MATYFVNAAGSNTSPFDTPAKGATNFGALAASVGTFTDGDIIEVVAGTEIDDSGASFAINTPDNHRITIRSYGTDGTDRVTAKPLIKVRFSSSFKCGEAKVIPTIQNLRIYKDENQGSLTEPIVDLQGSAPSFGITVEGCELYCILAGGPRCIGLRTGLGPSSYIINNVIRNVSRGIQLINDNSGLHLLNNSIYDFTEWGIIRQGTFQRQYYRNNTIHGNNRSGVRGISYSGNIHGDSDYNDIYGCPGGAYGSGLPGVHDIFVDPLFVNAPNGNLKLQSGSPCIGAGAGTDVDAYIPVTDFDGVTRPQGSDWDMGAYEYVAVPLNPPTILIQPSSQTIFVGDTLILATQASGAVGYSWNKDGTALSDASNAVLSRSSSTLSYGGSYQCLVGNADGTVASNTVTISVEGLLDRQKQINATDTPQVGRITVFRNGSARAESFSYPGL